MRIGNAVKVAVGGGALLAACVFGIAAPAGAAPQVVGVGKYSCSKMTGTVKFNPKSKSGTHFGMKIVINFTATGCTGGVPVPLTVTGQTSFASIQGSTCPLLGLVGKAVFHLTYVPAVIAPSIATLNMTGALTWKGVPAPGVAGSYPSAIATMSFLPHVANVGGGCLTPVGVTLMNMVSGSLSGF